MELLASVTWMSSSYDSLDILLSDKLIYNFPLYMEIILFTWNWKGLAPLASRAASLLLLLEQ